MMKRRYHPDDLRDSPRADLRDVVDFRWSAALDNYEPVPRNVAAGRGQYYTTDDMRGGIALWDHSQLSFATSAVYLIDDGLSVRPYSCVGWLSAGTTWDANGVATRGPDIGKADPDVYLTLHPFPVNVDHEGNPRMRPDGQPVDFDTWMLGPRRAYHLKVKRS